jgi:hypothetical protein
MTDQQKRLPLGCILLGPPGLQAVPGALVDLLNCLQLYRKPLDGRIHDETPTITTVGPTAAAAALAVGLVPFGCVAAEPSQYKYVLLVEVYVTKQVPTNRLADVKAHVCTRGKGCTPARDRKTP